MNEQIFVGESKELDVGGQCVKIIMDKRSEHNNISLQLLTHQVKLGHYTKGELFTKETRPLPSTQFWVHIFCAHS